ncbi:putative methyltransferase-like protein 7A [Dreissena polymorpha]|uniref:Methyltransferase type 11 domain-containing protein n=1 Tax=Dreissena polymorpha TaxID=45954 RepID=A0A9D4R077_DREPO|nr:putative methyltransferase-like protein 7A [Dreissena polymorpha]KAH3849287.1 hypothetical protein DPMN_091686 [Dreissena polymorpha]
MAAEDAAIQQYVLKVGSVLAVVGLLWYYRRMIQQKLFAWFMNKITKRTNRAFYKYKKKVFASVHNYQQAKNRDLSILEVGAGSAANLQFFPVNTELTCLDPNTNFVGYIKSNLEKCNKVVSAEIVQGYAEDMPFKSDTFDVVVSTLVLCSVKDVEKSLREIKRVLKPGGMFVFLEHVADQPKTFIWYSQRFMNPLHRTFADGCETMRNTDQVIANAGFKKVNIDNFKAKGLPFWLRPCIVGTASKLDHST